MTSLLNVLILIPVILTKPQFTLQEPHHSEFCGLNYELTHGGERIAGGREADEAEFPWTVSIQSLDNAIGQVPDRWVHECTGSIISPQLILTAGHCFTFRNESISRVVAGCRNYTSKSSICQVIPITHEDLFPHPGYNWRMDPSLDDIGIIKLKEKFRYTNRTGGAVGPICLPVMGWPDPERGDEVIVAGWGYMEDQLSRWPWTRYGDYDRHELVMMSQNLRNVRLYVLHPQKCVVFYYENDFINATQICTASNRMYEGSCSGDSGGPVMMTRAGRHFVIGVHSYGSICGRGPQNPEVHTRVSAYIKWIRSTAGELLLQ